jgi:hypothetical protein
LTYPTIKGKLKLCQENENTERKQINEANQAYVAPSAGPTRPTS